jgi:chorismate dehydratase
MYDLIPNHSISAKGPVGSIFLFSKRPIESLDRMTVLTTSQSETSVALLRIVLDIFYKLECPLQASSEPIGTVMRNSEAYMLIGDDALAEAVKWPGLNVYDLGDLWHKNTGLPFTFALWIVRKDSSEVNKGLIEKFIADLDMAKASALQNLANIAAESPLRKIMSEEALVSYWRGISYDFGEEHKKGFALFSRYCKELGLI